jgi:hypothetical protein
LDHSVSHLHVVHRSLRARSQHFFCSDNNEWGLFELQYGMQTVNRTNGEFTRRYKRSMFDYVDFFQRYVEGGRK